MGGCIEEKQEKIVVSTGCMDIISYSALSEEQQKEECFRRLEIQGINNSDCEFMDAEVVSCGPEVLGDRLVCTFICKEVTNEK